MGGKLTIGPGKEADAEKMPVSDPTPVEARPPSPLAPSLAPIQLDAEEVSQEAELGRQANLTVSQQANDRVGGREVIESTPL